MDQKLNTQEEETKVNVLLDFSNTFKQGTRAFKPKKKKANTVQQKNNEEQNDKVDEESKEEKENPNKDLEDENFIQPDFTSNQVIEIPRNLTITQQDMQLRKQMDMRRWFCMARPQHPKSCGISSLTSCWNFLYSTLGAGTLRPISTEEALEILGFKPPYANVDFGSFTGNDTLIQWFQLINKFFKVKGKAQISWKMHGKGKTLGVESDEALNNLMNGLRCERKAYIYHCWNHYMCPIGFEQTPTHPFDSYKKNEEICEFDTWIIIGEVSKCYPVFHTKRWEDIATDINCAFPKFFNIRKSELGVQEKTSQAFTEGNKLGGNLHCLIEFENTEIYTDDCDSVQTEVKENKDVLLKRDDKNGDC